jgi:spermidine synthase
MWLTPLFIVAWLEWFVTLSVQMLVLRLAVPVVWSSLIVTSVFIGVILLALSFGYLEWAKKAARMDTQTVKNEALRILTIALVWYVLWTFPFLAQMLEWMLQTWWSYYWALFVVAWVLIFPPVYIAAQLLPLLAELTPYTKRWEAAWKLLFVSTIWSFIWSIGTSMVLIQYLWVQNTWMIAVVILLLSCTILAWSSKKYLYIWVSWTLTLLLLWWWTMLDKKAEHQVYQKDTVYQNISLAEYTHKNGKKIKVFHTNEAWSSWIFDDHKSSPFLYIETFVDITRQKQPATILVIWWAWLVYPYLIQNDSYVQNIVTVDIDGEVFAIAQDYFLRESLAKNVELIAGSARFQVREFARQGKYFDMVVLDAYNGRVVPDELVTLEFFQDVNKILKPNGDIVANVIWETSAENAFTQRLYATMLAVWPELYALPMSSNTTWLDNIVVTTIPWVIANTTVTNQVKNIAALFTHHGILASQTPIYTDNLRTTEIDLFRTLYKEH